MSHPGTAAPRADAATPVRSPSSPAPRAGIGRELARILVEEGYDVVANAEDPGIHAVGTTVGAAARGATVTPVEADLATREGVETLARRVQELGRPVDALVLNAGVGVGGPFLETDLEAELRMIQLNVSSVVHLAKRLLPGMVARRQGRVLVTSSIAAQMPAPFEAVYAGTKAFELNFAEGIRNELKDTGVTVTVLQPGPTETNFFHRAGMDDTRVGASDAKDDAATVARDGYEAMLAGKDHVVAGSLMNKVQSVVFEAMPETHEGSAAPQALGAGHGRRRGALSPAVGARPRGVSARWPGRRCA
jgi:short-subunit dehydrogenase